VYICCYSYCCCCCYCCCCAISGASKILFELPLLYFILAKYAVACALTVVAKEAITAVAWDSAGVTTGPGEVYGYACRFLAHALRYVNI
jgi:hypothetical protein